MRLERVYEWHVGEGLQERDPKKMDPQLRTDDAIRLGHISDTHLGKDQEELRRRQLRCWLDDFVRLGADAVVHSGDLVESSEDEESVRWAFGLFDELPIPLLGVPGNHDVKAPGDQSAVTRRWGPFPRCVAIEDLQIWLFDSMAWPPAEERSQREQDAARQSGFFSRGGIGETQRHAVSQALQNHHDGARLAVVHHHLRQPVPQKPWYEANADLMRPLDDVDPFVEQLRSSDVTLVLHGHRHQYVAPYAPFEDLVILNGGSSTPGRGPGRARVIDITGKGASLRVWEFVRFS